MAKALVGHLRIDQRIPDRQSMEVRRLRRRVSDLEALVLHLQADNDRLRDALEESAALPAASVLATEMLPA